MREDARVGNRMTLACTLMQTPAIGYHADSIMPHAYTTFSGALDAIHIQSHPNMGSLATLHTQPD